ncbi:EAL domain-containing protein [Cupriavidus agavae]|uniref:cyclic-guanylate-specific phosphodiesterase n=1 Tax=Cupriavidus agavae TaxID=1001822 RepID=A0A4Q7RSS0_9BURK|nr:EAL domain-containing protein [Cupriavidus agavae]RZT36726.1 sensor c-di-GMP phosphodiesterase-like protein [Cupriavidus agavae]
MSRLRLWFFMFCVVALGICGPVALTAWLSHEFAEQLFRQRVDQFTERALQRVEAVARDAIAAAGAADAFAGHDCSAAHLDAMREADLQHRYVRQITYLDQGQLLCASSSMPGALRSIEGQTGTWTPLAALGASYRPGATNEPQRTMQFRVGRHVAVVDAQFFIDIVPFDEHIRLGMIDTGTGRVVVAWHDTDGTTLHRAWVGKLDGQLRDGRYLDVRQSASLPFAVVAYEPSVELASTWTNLLYASVPVALVVSMLATWLMLRWGRRLRSPEHALRDAIRRKEFFVLYQPVMALEDGRCVGAEALVRWRMPDGQVAMPDNFIPMAEAVGVIHAITRCMIEVLVRDLGTHLAAHPGLHVSINLSAEDFRRADTLPFLSAELARAGVGAEQVWIEVTERGFANDAACRDAIAAFRRAGHLILIDDFGTGYSSLAYLQDLDVDGLKIDRAFVESMTTDSPTRSVGPHIIDMARALDMRMVAEGIETAPQREALQQRGVQYGQGWLFGKAMPAPAFLDFWRRHAIAGRTVADSRA